MFILKYQLTGVINQYKMLIPEREYIILHCIFSENDCDCGIHM